VSRSSLARTLVLAMVMSMVASFAALPAPAQGQAGRTTLVLLHTSDYHAHARPHYSDGEQGVGGIARLIQYLRDEKAANPNTVILSGGDTMNLGTPAWSDKYQCAEWPLFNGLQDAMALGNHEQDYGWARFEECRASATYPVISAGLVNASNEPVLQPWIVVERGGVKLGLFALTGSDFEKLIKPELRPEGARYADGEVIAPAIVQRLREVEKVDAVVEIGHRFYEDDVKLAQAVSGIDLILGTHSHRKEDLKQIPGTSTYRNVQYFYCDGTSRRTAATSRRPAPASATRWAKQRSRATSSSLDRYLTHIRATRGSNEVATVR
jgi:5'-nucleotidase / UDP-sugar diphosphatase